MKSLVDNKSITINEGDEPMIEFTEVRKAAKGDQAAYAEIFNFFFKGRIQGWLVVSKGIDDPAEREDIIEEMMYAFVKHLPRYKREKLSFNIYMWKEFNFCFLNYIKRINKERQRQVGITPNCSVSRGFGVEIDTKMDAEILSARMTGKTKQVFEAMAGGLQRKDMKALELTVKDWDTERLSIQETATSLDYTY